MVTRFFAYPRTMSALVFVVVLMVGQYVVELERAREEEVRRSEATVRASTIRASVEAELNSTIYLGIGMSGYFSLGQNLERASVQRMLASVYGHGKNIRNIGVAPGNRLEYIYPLEGNEAALGLEYEKLPSQWEGVKRAIESKQTVVVGPVQLVQGGYGIITRTPVFNQDGTYWGIISVVIDVTTLLDTVAESAVSRRTDWALRTTGRDSVDFVYGDEQLFSSDTIRYQISLPGSTWEMAVMPTGGASGDLVGGLFSRRLLNFPVALLMALLVYLVLRERTKVHYMAVHDTLTGLPNRRLLFERLEQRISLAVRYSNAFCLIYIDLDRFKPINDNWGHRCGDQVLVEIANRMRSVVRSSDTVARVGGDEFVVLLPDTSEMSGAEAVCRNLLGAVEQPVTTDRGDVTLGASVGVARYPDHGMKPSELLAFADSAMYADKEQSRADAGTVADRR